MTTSAVQYAILDRHKYLDFAISGFDDFVLGDSETFDSLLVLSDPRISLYALDFERNAACFVKHPAAVALETRPFLFQAQFNEATHLIAIPLDEFVALAASVEVDDSRIAFIQSVGRCGSTLVSRVLGSMRSVRSLSEPDAFTNLVGWRGSALVSDSAIRRLADSCVRICCRSLAGSDTTDAVAIKFRSQCIEIDDLLADAFPAAKHLYLTREPISWLDSSYRAFIAPQKVDDFDYRTWVEDTFCALHPLIKEEVVEGKPMPAWKSSLLNWIANSETFRKHQDRGIPYFVVDFSEIKSNGLETMQRILEYCAIPIDDLRVIEQCLSHDSQRGSGFEQTIINKPARRLPKEIQVKARNLLAQYGCPTGAWS